MGSSAATRWRLFFHGDDFYASLLADIGLAREEILVEVYIFADDEIGRLILERLVARAREGVRVRLVIDGVGSRKLSFSPQLADADAEPFFDYRVFNPLRLRTLFHSRTNRRNHRKLLVIDRSICYVGGMNLCREQSESAMGEAHWRDTMVRLEGAIATQAEMLFEQMWRELSPIRMEALQARVKPLRQSSISEFDGFRLLINSPWWRRFRYKREFVRALGRSEYLLWMQTAYFIPRLYIYRHLLRQAKRGCDVRILVSEKSDVPMARWAGRATYGGLLRRGARVFEYRSRFSHAKTLLIDESLAVVGSSNMDYRSFVHNREIDLFSTNPDFCLAIKEQLIQDLSESKEIRLRTWVRRPFYHRAIEKFFYLFRYWL